MLSSPGISLAEETPHSETLCILDFNRLGDNDSYDWLTRGLADMMITTMNQVSRYRVLDRGHIREILKEHVLLTSGVIELNTALQQAQIAKAELLLLGNFVVEKEKLVVEARLLRISDQQLLAMTKWEGKVSQALEVSKALSKKLLATTGASFDPALLSGIEKQVPKTIDVAKSFYKGVEAYENGEYPEALAHYLDGVEKAGSFIRIYRAALHMYYLLGQKEQVVAFAATKGHQFEESGEPQYAAELYFAAAEKAVDSLSNKDLAQQYLDKLLRLTERDEQQTGQAAKTKEAFISELLNVHTVSSAAPKQWDYTKVIDRWKPYLWLDKLSDQLLWTAETQAEGGYFVEDNGKWVKKVVTDPTVSMWKIRAHHYLAELFVGEKDYAQSLGHYKKILQEYEFIDRLPIFKGQDKFYWRDDIKDAAQRSLWQHHREKGKLFRDDYLLEKFNVYIVTNGETFRREFNSLDRHPQADQWVKHENWGVEDFQFAAPPSAQIDSVTLQAQIKGLAFFDIGIPFSQGERKRMFSGKHTATINLKQGTELVKIDTQWGCGWSGKPWECLVGYFIQPSDKKQILWWEASFNVSPKETISSLDEAARKDTPEADRYIINHEAIKHGWDSATVIREANSQVYEGTPALDVYAEDWLVLSLNGDIHIFQQNNPQLTISLPASINTGEYEFDAALVKTGQGRRALFWTRGQGGKLKEYFVATTSDLREWDYPRTLKFAKDDSGSNIRESTSGRTSHIVDTPGGYLMLLEDGFVRQSTDLQHWESPKKLFSQQGHNNAVLKTRDGRIWIVYADYSPHAVRSVAEVDPLSGHSVVNGKIMLHRDAICAINSTDGHHWSPVIQIDLDRETSGLWAFPLADDQIGIVTQYNNYYLKWFRSLDVEHFQGETSPVTLLLPGPRIYFFVKDGLISAAQSIEDSSAEHRDILLIRTSEKVSKRLLP